MSEESTIVVEKITDVELMREACKFTMRNKRESKATLEDMYECEHSPMRTQFFTIKMYNIPTFVSVHLVRHTANGVLHFVGSHREDRGGTEGADRHTPTDHMIIANAQHLVDISRKRLCLQASKETVEVWREVAKQVGKVDSSLEKRMVPECIRRGGICHEPKSCGLCTKESKGGGEQMVEGSCEYSCDVDGGWLGLKLAIDEEVGIIKVPSITLGSQCRGCEYEYDTPECSKCTYWDKPTGDDGDNPRYYKKFLGEYEVFDIIEESVKDLTGTEAVCTANVLKYILRSGKKHKNPLEDLKKAQWYLQRRIDHLEG